MADNSSSCSDSPERNNLLTPVNGTFDDRYTQVMGQYPFLSPTSGYNSDDMFRSPERRPIGSGLPPPTSFGDLGFSPLHGGNAYMEFLKSEKNKQLPRPEPETQGFGNWNVSSTRFLKLTGINPIISSTALFNYLNACGEVQEYKASSLRSEGLCVVAFWDLRDSIAAYTKIRAEQGWMVQYCSQAYYSMLCTDEASEKPTDVLCAIMSGKNFGNSISALFGRLHEFGKINKFTSLRNMKCPSFLISFADPQVASDVVEMMDSQYLSGFQLRVFIYPPDQVQRNPFPGHSSLSGLKETSMSMPANLGTPDIWSPNPIRPYPETMFTFPRSSLPRSPDSHGTSYETDSLSRSVSSNLFSGIYSSPQPTSFDSLSTLQASSTGTCCSNHATQQNWSCGNAHNHCPHSPPGTSSCQKDSNRHEKGSNQQISVPGKNIIDLDRIARGLDTRTTVMLRNIPNKVDQQTLKDYIDETSRGLYNFLYLRIDFRNICNVGYAFINFLDPLDIIDFVKAKSGTRWNKFNSEKVLDVTYANIQGIDQLVEKFRNSSVMDQDPAYRPKLFYSSGPLSGTEMDFPPANNILKKCRSISAAQQIGLFAPKLSAASKGVWRKRD
ncbi:RNA recognition motif 2-domain-containing protein [Sphaerosporella brunnea]|uniref:RNA recognition motif 2-domain-containing protein n=1 Tax=Sphaerosporella brunnea TaxID=1250544 RepID=A0A5J5F4U7_9PEZI|nr:RNA recognition motif 2-domain-containing protein [Sphaerosporella brunnea]